MLGFLRDRVNGITAIILSIGICVGVALGIIGTKSPDTVGKSIEFSHAITNDNTYVTFEINSKKLLVITGISGTSVVELK